MSLSPENQKLWNKYGLTQTNGVITLSTPALELLLDAAREEGRDAQPVNETPKTEQVASDE